MTLSFINQKGGVGKTTLSMNVAVRLKMAGAKVLLVDMDPQCNLTYIMGCDRPPYTILDVLTGKVTARQAIFHAPEADILPGSPNLSLLERQLTGSDRGTALRRALETLEQDYQFVVVDSPPALGLLMLNALGASDSIVIPAYADIFSLQGIGQLYSTLQAVKAQINPGLHIDGILLSRSDTTSKLAQDVEQMLRTTAQRLQTEVFEAGISRCIAVQEAQALRKSIFLHAPDSPPAAEYSCFVLEYLQRIRKRLRR